MDELQRSPVAAVAAVIAACGGIVLLALAGVRLVGSSDSTAVGTAAPSTTTTTTTTTTTITTAPFDPGEFVRVVDDTGSVSVSVPAAWSDIVGRAWTVDDVEVGLALTASTDVSGWYDTWGVPGIFVGVATTEFVPGLGDFSGTCSGGKVADRSGERLQGRVQAWSGCGDEGGDFYVFLGAPPDGFPAVLIQLVSTDGTGLAVLDEVLATFSFQSTT